MSIEPKLHGVVTSAASRKSREPAFSDIVIELTTSLFSAAAAASAGLGCLSLTTIASPICCEARCFALELTGFLLLNQR